MYSTHIPMYNDLYAIRVYSKCFSIKSLFCMLKTTVSRNERERIIDKKRKREEGEEEP